MEWYCAIRAAKKYVIEEKNPGLPREMVHTNCNDFNARFYTTDFVRTFRGFCQDRIFAQNSTWNTQSTKYTLLVTILYTNFLPVSEAMVCFGQPKINVLQQ